MLCMYSIYPYNHAVSGGNIAFKMIITQYRLRVHWYGTWLRGCEETAVTWSTGCENTHSNTFQQYICHKQILIHGGRWSSHTAQIFLTRPSVSSCVLHGCHPLERFPSEWGHLSEQGSVLRGLTILHKSFWLGQERYMTLWKNKFFKAKRTHSIVEKTSIRFFKRKPKTKGCDIKLLMFCHSYK